MIITAMETAMELEECSIKMLAQCIARSSYLSEENEINSEKIREAFSSLEGKKQKVLYLRMGLGGGQVVSQLKVAQELNLTLKETHYLETTALYEFVHQYEIL